MAGNINRHMVNVLVKAKNSVVPIVKSCTQIRMVHDSAGAVLDRPSVLQFGTVKGAVGLAAGVYVGGMLAKHGAAFLEDNDIFVPTDEDD